MIELTTAGLLEDVRQGISKPNKIYILNLNEDFFNDFEIRTELKVFEYVTDELQEKEDENLIKQRTFSESPKQGIKNPQNRESRIPKTGN